VNVDFVFGNNNIVECFFSLASRLCTDYRKGMTPYSLEMLLFLKYNRKLWDRYDFATAMKRSSRTSWESKREQDDFREHQAEIEFNDNTEE
jgi:hypothetical protein